MQSGNFYFIKDDFYEKFFDEKDLKPNKDDDCEKHGRPCYYAFKESDSEIMWMVPISSQVEKYEKIYNEQIKKYNPYDGIKFGYVLGRKTAFLIQNMCPVIPRYVKNEYIDNATNKPVVIKDVLASNINASVRKAVRLYRRGTKIVFPDILKMESILLEELKK